MRIGDPFACVIFGRATFPETVSSSTKHHASPSPIPLQTMQPLISFQTRPCHSLRPCSPSSGSATNTLTLPLSQLFERCVIVSIWYRYICSLHQAGPATSMVTSFLQMPSLRHPTLWTTIRPSKTAQHSNSRSCCSNEYRPAKATSTISCALLQPITSRRMAQMLPSIVPTTYYLQSMQSRMVTRHGSHSLCATPELLTRTPLHGSERNSRYIAAMHVQSLTISLAQRNLMVSSTSRRTRSISPTGVCATRT